MTAPRKIALLNRELERAHREHLAAIRAEIEETRLRIQAEEFKLEKLSLPR